MRIFVTGGTGLIGAHLLKIAIRAGHEVIALRRRGSSPSIPLPISPSWIEGDLESLDPSHLESCDCLVHLAAHGATDPSNATWEDCFRWNVTASLQLWLSAISAGVRRIVVAGSCFEYGRSAEQFDFIPTTAPLLPTGAYHASKAAATMAAIGLGIDKRIEMLVLRPFHVFGEGEMPHRFWPSLRKAALDGVDFPMSSGDQIRDFVPVEMAARAFLQGALRTDLEAGNPLVENVGTGIPKSLRQFALEEWEKFGGTGSIHLGKLPLRANEVMRYVPEISL